MFLKTAIIFSGIVNVRQNRALPLYLMLIVSNALPVYGAAIGKLVFFQVIYLYWFESLLRIVFDCIRIAAARGTGEDAISLSFGTRLALILRTILVPKLK